MNYFDWSGLFAAVGVLAFLQLALAIVGIIGSLISLFHSLKHPFTLHKQLPEWCRQMCSGMNAQQHITPVCQHHMNSSCLRRNRKCGKECIQMFAHQYSAYRLKKHKDKKEHIQCSLEYPSRVIFPFTIEMSTGHFSCTLWRE